MSCVNSCSFVNINALCHEMYHRGSVPLRPSTRCAVRGSTCLTAPPSVYLTERRREITEANPGIDQPPPTLTMPGFGRDSARPLTSATGRMRARRWAEGIPVYARNKKPSTVYPLGRTREISKKWPYDISLTAEPLRPAFTRRLYHFPSQPCTFRL
jgi:hypothetical protein